MKMHCNASLPEPPLTDCKPRVGLCATYAVFTAEELNWAADQLRDSDARDQ